VACVAHLANDWRSAGRIDRGPQGRVIACASTDRESIILAALRAARSDGAQERGMG